MGSQFYKVCINDDPGLTMTYFTSNFIFVTSAFEWGKTVTMSSDGKKLEAKDLTE